MMVMNKKGESVELVPDKESKAGPGRDISTGTLDMVARLGLRSRKVARATRLLGAGLAVVSVITLLVSFAVSWASPESVSIDSVDIPSILLGHFDGVAAGGGGKMTTAIDSLGESLSDIAPFLGGAALILGLICAVLTQSFTPMIGAMMAMLPIFMIQMIGGGSEDSSSQYNEKEAFAQVVQDLDYGKALDKLLVKGLANDPSGAYVLSQIAVAMELPQDESELAVLRNQAQRAVDPQEGFEPKGSALYVIQSKLFGKPTSPGAALYLEDRERLHLRWKTASGVFNALAGVLLALTLGASLLLYLVSTRLNRVLGLIAPYTYRRGDKS